MYHCFSLGQWLALHPRNRLLRATDKVLSPWWWSTVLREHRARPGAAGISSLFSAWLITF